MSPHLRSHTSPMLVTVTVALGLSLAACSDSPLVPPTPPDMGPRSMLDEAAAAAARAACTFKAGTPPGLSLASTAPIGSQIPINNIVVVMMENRSFDHLLGDLPSLGVKDVDVAAADASNPDATGAPVARFHLADLCFDDTNHEWSGSHDEYDAGKNDGFVLANRGGRHDPDGRRAMGFYTATDLPFTTGLAAQFAIGDRYFDSLLGPTFPNREFLYAATSFGNTSNVLVTQRVASLFDSLDAAGVPWLEYHESRPGGGILAESYTRHLDSFPDLPQFFVDAQAGKLPPVALVDPNLNDVGADHDDFHPPGDLELGDAYLERIVRALVASPQWPHTALFITWDENGGLYDHVAPPQACVPDALPVKDGGGFVFDRLGFRVPVIVVSPYARPRFVSHVVHDHTSILRFIETRFGLPALTARDANADPMLEMFDFSAPKLLAPPSLPAAHVDQAKLDACRAMFPLPGTVDAGSPPDAGAGDGT